METADIALMKNDLRKPAMAVNLGQQARTKIQQNICLSVATKILIVLAAVGYASLWGAVLADVGTCLIVIFNSMLILKRDKDGSCLGFMHCHEHKHIGNHCQKRGKGCTDGESCCVKAKSMEGPACCKSKACHGHIQAELGATTTKSCCDVSEKNPNGIRWRASHMDTCAKDCQGVDCSSGMVTISEGSSVTANITEPGNSCLKRTGLLEGVGSRIGQHTCCQPQNKNVSSCCTNNNSDKEHASPHVSCSKVDGLEIRGTEGAARQHAQCGFETKDQSSCSNDSLRRAHSCNTEANPDREQCGVIGGFQIEEETAAGKRATSAERDREQLQPPTMMDAHDMVAHPRAPDEIFRDFKCRRSGILKALTTEVDLFVRQCDPARENLCLYGHPDESWEVNLPAEEVPTELPEPVLGINFSRDGMDRRDWLSLVAVHSDSWLLAVAAFFAARFDKNKRKKLFNQIIDLPTLCDVVIGRKSTKDKATANNNGTKMKSLSVGKVRTVEEDDDEEHENTLCGKCGGNYAPNEFWICCDICEEWFHGKRVKMTPARAEHIKQFKCPSCSIKKPRV